MKKIDITLYCQNIWNHRYGNRNALVNELVREYDADFCCFQECGHKTNRAGHQPIEDLMVDAYEEVYTEVGKLNYTPVFYKRERFDCVKCGYFLYEGKNDSNSKSVTWAILEDKETKVRLGVCSTHFWWKNDSEDDNQQRIANANALADCVEKLRDEYDVPVIACGDLNCGRYSGQGEDPYYALRERLLDARVEAPVTTDKLTHHSYPVEHEDGSYTEGGEPKRTLDHVFFAEHRNIKCISFDVDVTPKALTTSDHCPLVFKAEIYG